MHLDLAGHRSFQDKAFGIYCPLLCSLLSHVVLLPLHYGNVIIVGWNAHNPMKIANQLFCGVQAASGMFATSVGEEKYGLFLFASLAFM